VCICIPGGIKVAGKGIFARIKAILSKPKALEVVTEAKQEVIGMISNPIDQPSPKFSGNSSQRRKQKRQWVRQNNLQNSK